MVSLKVNVTFVLIRTLNIHIPPQENTKQKVNCCAKARRENTVIMHSLIYVLYIFISKCANASLRVEICLETFELYLLLITVLSEKR